MSEREILEAEDLGEGAPVPAPGPASTDTRMSLAEAERRHIEAVLLAEGGSVRAAATVLKLSRTALYDRIKKHGIPLGGGD